MLADLVKSGWKDFQILTNMGKYFFFSSHFTAPCTCLFGGCRISFTIQRSSLHSIGVPLFILLLIFQYFCGCFFLLYITYLFLFLFLFFFFSLFLAGLVDAPPLHRYCTAGYWVVATMTSTGYGDIHGDSNSEMGEDS